MANSERNEFLWRRTKYSKFVGNAATRYGLMQERPSCFKYLEWLEKEKGSAGAKVNIKCGLVISSTHPWLAATPDGLVNDPQATPQQGLKTLIASETCF